MSGYNYLGTMALVVAALLIGMLVTSGIIDRRYYRKRSYYHNPARFIYRSKRYRQSVTVPANMHSDGATGATDLWSQSWWVHDRLCRTGQWDNGGMVVNWQASTVLYDILMSEGRWIRAPFWRIATFLFGGGKCRENGMIYAGNQPQRGRSARVD